MVSEDTFRDIRRMRAQYKTLKNAFRTEVRGDPNTREDYSKTIAIATQELARANTCLRQIQAEVARVQAIQASLEAQLKETKEYLTIQRSIFAPIRRLPNELLGLIFSNFADQVQMNPFPYTGTFRARQVCKRWSDIIHSLGILWCDIHWEVVEAQRERAGRFLKKILGRTHERTLKFFSNGVDLTISEILASHAPRIGSLWLANLSMDYTPLLNPLRDLHRLRTLHLDDVAIPESFEVFSSASNIREVKFSTLDPWHLSRIQLDWSLITHLDLNTWITWEWCYYLSLSATNLHNLNITNMFMEHQRESITWGVMLEFPTVQRIVASYGSSPYALGFLRFPALSSFVLSTSGGEEVPDVLPELLNLVKRSAKCLEQISLENPYLSTEREEHLIQLCKAAPNVTQFQITGSSHEASPVTTMLIWDDSDPDHLLLPKLDTILIDQVGDTQMEDVVRVVQSRGASSDVSIQDAWGFSDVPQPADIRSLMFWYLQEKAGNTEVTNEKGLENTPNHYGPLGILKSLRNNKRLDLHLQWER